MNLQNIQTELEKRIIYPYKWFIKQNDEYDKLSDFVYKTDNFEEILRKINQINIAGDKKELFFNYTINRWYNFYTAQAIEACFHLSPKVRPFENKKDKFIDFYINDIPFDLKISVFPSKYEKDINTAINHKDDLIKWLYANQSQERRFHKENRLFFMLYDAVNLEHWKLKSQIKWLSLIIHNYLETFRAHNLLTFSSDDNIIYTDIIWAINHLGKK